MPGRVVLTPAQIGQFGRRGILRLPGLLSAQTVRRAREHVQLRLARWGLWKDGAWCLDDIRKPQWPATGFKTSKIIGNKHPVVEALAEEPAVLAVVAALLDGHTVDRKMSGRPQILFTLPNSDTWTVPTAWHIDHPRLPSGRQPGVIRSRELRQLLGREAFFRELYSNAPDRAGERRTSLGRTGTVAGVTLEIVELTGPPGDAYFTDLRVLHSGAPNTAGHPRIMATHRFVRADVTQELAAGYGWE